MSAAAAAARRRGATREEPDELAALQAFLAALPIALVVLAMTTWRWRAATAGAAALALAIVVAYAAFGVGLEAPGSAPPLVGALLEAAFTTATILWIVFPALWLFELQQRSGALDALRGALARLTDERHVLALLVAWFFGLFMEGVAGFGTPVALAAPLLVGLGFTPVKAVVLALVGHAAGVSFGALGTPVMPQVEATGIPAGELSHATALLHALLGWILVAFLLRLSDDRWPGARVWLLGAGAAAAFFLPYFALASVVGPELPTLGAALLGGALFAFFARSRGAHAPAGELLHAGLPYLVLVALVLVTRLVPAAGEALRGLRWEWSLAGGFGGSIAPLYHPGTLLALGLVAGGFLQGRSPGQLGVAARAAAGRLVPVALALLAMLALSRVLVHAGMIRALAEAAATTGPAWPLLAPFIGVLGTFVTGSATASNILFAGFQDATASALGLQRPMMQAAQSFGAAVGNVICPHNVVAGGATVGLSGREGEVLRGTLPAALVYGAAGGVLLLLIAAE